MGAINPMMLPFMFSTSLSVPEESAGMIGIGSAFLRNKRPLTTLPWLQKKKEIWTLSHYFSQKSAE
jgi:hypothetical protein